jgi:hypothetical protein
LLYVTAFGTIKNESLFRRFSHLQSDPSDLGRQQFFEHQSYGIIPEKPDPYYLSLEDGKHWFDWLSEELRKDYLTDKWPGWCQLREDWKGDLETLRLLTKWHKR